MKNKPQNFAGISRRRAAVTLAEAMFVMVVMGIIAMGTGSALQTLLRVPHASSQTLIISNLLIDKMEYLRSLGYTTLSTTANGSDSPVIDNVTYVRSWTITANPGGQYDASFLQLTVTIRSQSLISAVCKQ